MAQVQLKQLNKTFPLAEGRQQKKQRLSAGLPTPRVTAVRDLSLDIADREFLVLVGPSGCGKSTVLRLIAGLEQPDSGEVFIGGCPVNELEPQQRDIAMVFQNYALYPHMTVYENMAFSLQMKKLPKDEIDRRVREAAAILDITPYLERKPRALSGGQRQRVAIGRAIVRDPAVFLLDEPLSNLDAKLRSQMRTELIKLRQRIQTTFIYVTHDQTEAMTLGDRLVIMNEGRIQQIGTPQQVFEHPANTFVASFIGTPRINLLEAALVYENGQYYADAGGFKVELSGEKQQHLYARQVPPQAVLLGVRPDHLHLAETGLPATVDVAELMGAYTHLHLLSAGRELIAIVPSAGAEQPIGSPVCLSFSGAQVNLFDRETLTNLEFDTAFDTAGENTNV